jgi:hypothetical protein
MMYVQENKRLNDVRWYDYLVKILRHGSEKWNTAMARFCPEKSVGTSWTETILSSYELYGVISIS